MQIREFAHTGDALFSSGDVFGARSVGRIDLLGDPTALDGLEHAAVRLDFLKDFPSFLAKIIG